LRFEKDHGEDGEQEREIDHFRLLPVFPVFPGSFSNLKSYLILRCFDLD
jgi:hypothetical protein